MMPATDSGRNSMAVAVVGGDTNSGGSFTGSESQ
jgi:hypothetical protein